MCRQGSGDSAHQTVEVTTQQWDVQEVGAEVVAHVEPAVPAEGFLGNGPGGGLLQETVLDLGEHRGGRYGKLLLEERDLLDDPQHLALRPAGVDHPATALPRRRDGAAQHGCGLPEPAHRLREERSAVHAVVVYAERQLPLVRAEGLVGEEVLYPHPFTLEEGILPQRFTRGLGRGTRSCRTAPSSPFPPPTCPRALCRPAVCS